MRQCGVMAGSQASGRVDSNLYLGGRTGLLTESQSESTTSSEEWNGVPLGRKYDSAKAATFRSLPSAQDRGIRGLPSTSSQASNPFETRTNGRLLHYFECRMEPSLTLIVKFLKGPSRITFVPNIFHKLSPKFKASLQSSLPSA